MPFLPLPPPLTPYYGYPQQLHLRGSQHDEEEFRRCHQQQQSLADYPPFGPAPPPPPPGDDLSCCSGGLKPFFPTTFPEGFGDEEYYSLDMEALSWGDFGDFLDGPAEVGEEGSEAAAREADKSAMEKGRAAYGRGALLLPPMSRGEEQQLQHQQQLGWLELQMQQWSGTAKAARSKRRIARQMSNCVVPRFVLSRRSSSSSSSSSSTPPAGKSSGRNAGAGGGFPVTKKRSPTARAIVPLFPPVHMVGTLLFSPLLYYN